MYIAALEVISQHYVFALCCEQYSMHMGKVKKSLYPKLCVVHPVKYV